MDPIFLMELKLLSKCGRCNRKGKGLIHFLTKSIYPGNLKFMKSHEIYYN